MKKRILVINAAILAMLFLAVFYSCSADKYKMIEHKWLITTDEVILEFHPDSTFTGTERGEGFNGTWKLSYDGKYVVFKKKASSPKRLKIKALTATKLTLSDNGLEQDYVRGD
jgi:hypothetical protein